MTDRDSSNATGSASRYNKWMWENHFAKMKFILLLLWFTALDISAQYSDSGCSRRLLQLSDNFYDALRKVKSGGDLCKIGANGNLTELGPYQISEEYYNEAVEFDPGLGTGGNCMISVATDNDTSRYHEIVTLELISL